MNAVEDPKSGPEHSSAKSIALDHLGDIAARIRYFKGQMPVQPIPTVDEIISNADTEGAKALLQAHKRVDINLLASADEDDMYSVGHSSPCLSHADISVRGT
jgi:cohesin loading factor subunit SCC2